jgi:hypothetical protein
MEDQALAGWCSSMKPAPRTNMTRTHGRCAAGLRLVDKVPYGHWKTLTFVAALRCDRITAPWLFDGPINRLNILAM